MNWKEMTDEILMDIGRISAASLSFGNPAKHIVGMVQWNGKTLARLLLQPSPFQIAGEGGIAAGMSLRRPGITFHLAGIRRRLGLSPNCRVPDLSDQSNHQVQSVISTQSAISSQVDNFRIARYQRQHVSSAFCVMAEDDIHERLSLGRVVIDEHNLRHLSSLRVTRIRISSDNSGRGLTILRGSHVRLYECPKDRIAS